MDTVCDLEVYSDASGTGYGGYIAGQGGRSDFHVWTGSESTNSSTWMELEAVYRLLVEFASDLGGQCVRWYVDNMNVVRILSKGSMNEALQVIAVKIFGMSRENNVTLVPEWIPRQMNTKADELSRLAYTDCDDWQVSDVVFHELNLAWGPHTVDRFATDSNAKCSRSNSRIWVPGTEAINSFRVSWNGEINWCVPPPSVVPRVLSKFAREGAIGTLIVPKWSLAPYWPVLYSENKWSDFVTDVRSFPAAGNVEVGKRTNKMFQHLKFEMIACKIHFKA